jgi:hypothetical protein
MQGPFGGRFRPFDKNPRPIEGNARRTTMNPADPNSESSCAELYAEYRNAFARWAGEMAQLQAQAAVSDTIAALLGEAAEKGAMAELAYRQSRDRLLGCLATDSCPHSVATA